MNTNKQEYVKNYYENEAHKYNYTHGAGMFGAQLGIKKYYFNFLKKFINKNSKVLEVGCGTGVFTEAIKKISNNLIATDISKNMIVEAKKRNPDVEFREADIEKLPFNDQEFDIVVAINSFSYVYNKEKGIKEIYRILKKSGKFILIDMNFLSPIYYVTFLLNYSKRKSWITATIQSNRFFLKKLLKNNNFKILELFEANFIPHRATVKRAKFFYQPLDKVSNIIPWIKYFSMRIFIAGEKNG